MRIPRHWQRVEEKTVLDGKPVTLKAWGCSDTDPEDARRMARERLPRILKALSGKHSSERHRGRSYEYFADGIREIRLESWSESGREHTVLTRNGYGALVLNTERVMFIDIDVPEGRTFLFFGKGTAERKQAKAKEVEALVRKRTVPPVRIYETAAGLRLVALDKTYDPVGDEVTRIMQALGADPLYLRLCKSQGCFRARLSPKPYRIGVPNPPFRFPETPEMAPYKDWVQTYEEAGAPFRVCSILGTVGTDPGNPLIRTVLDIHDRHCGVQRSGTLA